MDRLHFCNHYHYLWQLLLSCIDCLLRNWQSAKRFPSTVFNPQTCKVWLSQLTGEENEMSKNGFALSLARHVRSQGCHLRAVELRLLGCKLYKICEVSPAEPPPFQWLVRVTGPWQPLYDKEPDMWVLLPNDPSTIFAFSHPEVLRARGECDHACQLLTADQGALGLVSGFRSSPLHSVWPRVVTWSDPGQHGVVFMDDLCIFSQARNRVCTSYDP